MNTCTRSIIDFLTLLRESRLPQTDLRLLQRLLNFKSKLRLLVVISVRLVTHIHVSHVHIPVLARVHVRVHVRIDSRRARCGTRRRCNRRRGRVTIGVAV